MRYLSLTDVEKPVSVIGLGTGTPKAFTPETYTRGAELLDAFLAAGGNCIDTAHIYGFGASEKTIGRWLRERQTRDQIVLITKGCHPGVDQKDILGKPWVPRMTPEALRADLSESLERLQTDWIDIYLLHRDDETLPVAPIMDALYAEIQRGRIRACGVSNWNTARIGQANTYAAENGLHGFIVSSPSLSLPRPQKFLFPGAVFAGDAERAWHSERQFPLVAWSSMGVGFLKGTVTPQSAPDSFLMQTYGSSQNFERLRRAQQRAAQKNVSAMQIGLAFVLQQDFPTIALIGPSNVAHLNECLSALDLVLTENERAYLDLKADTLNESV